MLHVAQTSSAMCSVIQARGMCGLLVVLFATKTLSLAIYSDTHQVLAIRKMS